MLGSGQSTSVLLAATQFVHAEPNARVSAAPAKQLRGQVCPALPASPRTPSSRLPFVLPAPKSQAGKDTKEGTVDTDVTLFPCCSVLYSETTADLAAAPRPGPCSASSMLRGPAEAGPAVPQGPGHYSIEICPAGLP